MSVAPLEKFGQARIATGMASLPHWGKIKFLAESRHRNGQDRPPEIAIYR